MGASSEAALPGATCSSQPIAAALRGVYTKQPSARAFSVLGARHHRRGHGLDVGSGVGGLDDVNAAPEAEGAGAAGHQERDGSQKGRNENSVHTHLRSTKWVAIGVEREGEVFWLRIGGRLAGSAQIVGVQGEIPAHGVPPMIEAPSGAPHPLPIADYARCLLSIAETVHCWLSSLAVLDEARRARVAGYAEKIAATLERAGEALRRLEAAPGDRGARERAVRELGRWSAPWSITLTGASSQGLKGG
jgi:hypothetical protein